MADGSYDNTNRGVIFMPHQDQQLTGQGNINIEGKEERVVMVYERLGRDKPPVQVLYRRLGPLFPNDNATSDKAPDLSGPMDDHPDHRMAAWRKEKDGRKFMSLSISRKDQSRSNGGGGGQQQQGYGGRPDYDDEIPF